MLGIRRIGAGRADYYLSDLAAELPAGGGGARRWVGEAAVGLGLDQGVPVEPARFRLLLAGCHPHTGRPLPLPAGRRVAGYDLCFSAPKSASVLFGLGGDEVARTVLAAHHEAVDAAFGYLERHGLGAVRRGGGDEREREVIATSGFAGARFTHGVNRNLDPHLHSHVVVVNAARGVDGRWSACDGRGLDAHRRAAGGVYEADLRAGLTASLGVRWDAATGRRAAEVSGMPPAVLGEFSSRGADIRMHADAFGARSARGRRVAWAATRPPKVTETSHRELAAEWRRRAGFAGLDGPVLEPGGGRSLTVPSTSSYDEHRFAGVLSETPHGGARRRDVVEAFAVSARDGVAAPSLEGVSGLWAPAGEGQVGVAEALVSRRSVTPGNHLLRALGPRPIDPDDHMTWVRAAGAIDAYRERWGIERTAEPLGDGAPSTLPPSRLADHLRVARQLDAARATLGRRSPVEMDLGLGR